MCRSIQTRFKSSLAITVLLLLATHLGAGQEKLTVEDILQRHLDSIGPKSIRAGLRSRVVEATTSYRVLTGGSAEFNGKAVLASDGNKLHVLLKINAPQYTGERFVSDGDKTSVEGTYASKARSEFGTFLRSEDLPLRDGLLGGVLTTAWPLLDPDVHEAKLSYEGLRKVDGTDLHVVAYKPHSRTGLEISLYFEPVTFHHVRTVYTETHGVGLMGPRQVDTMATFGRRGASQRNGSDARSARLGPTRWRIEEQFNNFKTSDGLTLPFHYDLRFEEQLQNGFKKIVEWDVTTTRVLNNISVDPRNFQIQ